MAGDNAVIEQADIRQCQGFAQSTGDGNIT
jgi:hypothetical protein